MSENPEYYLNTSIPEEERRNTAFQAVNAVRQSVTLAQESSQPITYEFAFGIIHDIDPEMYEAIIKLLTGKNQNELVRYYIDEAKASSTEDKIVEPIDLIITELTRIESLLEGKSSSGLTYLKKRKFNLVAAKEYFKPRKQSEHKSLNHDFYLRSRYEYFGKPLYDGDNFKDFKIGKNKVLRLRLMHPDREEAILGVDLVYEHFDMKLERVRFAHMQYKSWDNKVLYTSKSTNLLPQLEKMKRNLCDSGLCKGPENTERDYRFPYCSAFLRPTTKIQKPDSKLITTGLHLPICEAMKIIRDKGKIEKIECTNKSIKGHIFEELFNSNLTGSKWITFTQIEDFYEKKEILSHMNTIRVHAQEIDVETDYDKNKSIE